MRVRKRYHKRDRRIQRLYIVDDPYVAGVLASKLGLVEYALAHAEVLSTAYCSREFRWGEARRLFLAGVAFAQACTEEDVAVEMRWFREGRPDDWDAKVSPYRGEGGM